MQSSSTTTHTNKKGQIDQTQLAQKIPFRIAALETTSFFGHNDFLCISGTGKIIDSLISDGKRCPQ